MALIAAGHWSVAYYLIGYAVECGLKSCLLAHVERSGAIFQDREFSRKCWTHNVEELVKLAGLEQQRVDDASVNSYFRLNWLIVKDWNEGARYSHWSEDDAREIFQAVTNPNDGVLPWIMAHW